MNSPTIPTNYIPFRSSVGYSSTLKKRQTSSGAPSNVNQQFSAGEFYDKREDDNILLEFNMVIFY